MIKKLNIYWKSIFCFIFPFFVFNYDNSPFGDLFHILDRIILLSIVIFSVVFLSHMRTFKSYSLSTIFSFISYISVGYIILKTILLISYKYIQLENNAINIISNIIFSLLFVAIFITITLYKTNFLDISIKDNTYDYIHSDQYRTTVHEAGHLICYKLLINRPNIKVNIIDTRTSFFIKDYLGYVEREDDDSTLKNKDLLEWEMKMLLAGKELELFILGDSGYGAKGDFKRWNKVAHEYLSLGFGSVFYNKPKDDNERKINHIALSALKESQEKSLQVFFELNNEYIKKIIEKLYIEKQLDNDTINEIFEVNINETDDMKLISYK